MNIKKILFSLFFHLLFVCSLFPCTIWSAIGKSSKDDVTLIAKNRDWAPVHKQVLKTIKNKNGFAYFALMVEESEQDPGLKAGINEKGLVAFTASASSIPQKTRDAMENKKSLIKNILLKYRSVDELLTDKEIFKASRPSFYMVADKDNIAYIEVAIDGKYSISVKKNGVLYHTNHYLNKKFNYSNIKIGKSSLARYARIKSLLNENKKFTLADFKDISNDKNDGPDNSIWRTGSKEDKERTLAAWLVEIPKNGPAEVYVKIANPDKKTEEFYYIIDENFWKK